MIGPQMRNRLRFDQLRGNAHEVTALSNRALKHISHPKFAPDLSDVDGLPLVSEARIARDHEQPTNPGEGCCDLLDHAVSKIVLLRITRHVPEWQHSD